jgi:hypothetical protein
MNNSAPRRELWLLVGIVALSVALRCALLRVDRIVRWDEPDYLILGKHLFTGQGYTVSGRPELHYAPLFPITTGLLYPLTHNMEVNSDINYVFFGALTLVPFFLLTRRLFGLRVSTISAALLCLFPALNAGVLFWGTMLEPLYLFLLFSGLYAVWMAWEEQRVAAYLGAGVAFGLAYLTKPEAVVDFGWMMLLLVAANLWRRSLRPPWRDASGAQRNVTGLVVAVLAFGLVIAPYLFFMYRHTGRLMISGKLGVTYVAGQGAVDRDPGLYDRALSQLDEAGEEIIWFSPDRFKYQVWDYIRADPPAFLRRMWQNVNILERVFFTHQVFPFYLLMLVALGWFGSAWDLRRALSEGFLLAAALPVFVFLPFHIELRYFAPMLPILLVWVAKGAGALGEWLQATWSRLRPRRTGGRLGEGLTLILAALLAAYFIVLQPRVVQEGLADMSPSRREAGLWLKANASPDALIMSRDTEVPFYAERRWAATPNEEYARFIAYVRKRGAQFVVIDELNEDAPPVELKHVYTARDARGNSIVYEVLY